MGRPKGSKNKKAEPVKMEKKSDFVPPVKFDGPSPVEWRPAPDMGQIKPPAEAEKLCANADCTHKGVIHYGGPKGWCNVGGCVCEEFR